MSVWTFYNFLDARGKNVIKDWMDDEIPWKAKQNINTKLLVMRAMERWPEGWASTYEGFPGIIELRFPWNKVQYRPLGCYGPERRQFTLLIGAIEKGGKIRKSILETATEIMDNLSEDCICEHEYN